MKLKLKFNLKYFFATLLLLVSLSTATAQTIENNEPDNIIELKEIVITSQHGEQKMLDIPASISVISSRTLESSNVVNMEQLAGFVPGLNILVQSPGRPNLVIRGLTSDEVSPTAQPRVSVYLNHAPISRATMAITELYDMERIEVMKGPQGTLFGRGSQAGAISFITKKPVDNVGGYFTAGIGDYGMKHLEGAINMPVTDGLAARIAGIFSYYDGYVKNTSGGMLNNKNTVGERFSLSFNPKNSKFKADLIINYQKDENAGTAFMSKDYSTTDVFKYEASLDKDKDFYNNREVFGTILNARYYTSEKSYISSITSYFNHSADSRFDGDGTIAPAIDMAENVKAKQFMQELRYNFSYGDRLTGIAGTSFWRENVNHRYTFRPGEQYLGHLFMNMLTEGNWQHSMVKDNKPNPMTEFSTGALMEAILGIPVPDAPVLPLLNDHVEDNYTEATNSAADLFFDASYEIIPKLNFIAGTRATFEKFTITNRAAHVEGSNSSLGFLSGRLPNIFFKPVDNPERKESFFAITWRAGFKYDINKQSNIYAGYSKGRRPNVLQYNSEGKYEVIDAETLHSFDVGYRLVNHRFIFDVSLYYQLYRNFQSWRWEGMDYLQRNVDKATSYGVELSGRFLINSHLNIFGNYAFAHTAFDDKDNDGYAQLNAGNSFRLTPRHSFQAGFNASYDILNNICIMLTPSYSWKSHIFFEDANDPGIEQDAYGLLNANLSFLFKKQRLSLSLFGSNLTGEKYLIGAGNMGAMFGAPTVVPGAPRMIGSKLNWKF